MSAAEQRATDRNGHYDPPRSSTLVRHVIRAAAQVGTTYFRHSEPLLTLNAFAAQRVSFASSALSCRVERCDPLFSNSFQPSARRTSAC